MSVKRIVVGLVAAVIAATSLAGCSRPPAAAAVVDGVAIGLQQVQTAAPVLSQYLSSSSSFAGADFVNVALNWRIQGELYDQAAAAQGVTLTDDLRDQFVSQNYGDGSVGQVLWQNPASRPVFAGYVDGNVLSQLVGAGSLDDTQLMSSITAAPVTVNPRFGVWDATQGMVTQSAGTPSGLLADPVAFTMPA